MIYISRPNVVIINIQGLFKHYHHEYICEYNAITDGQISSKQQPAICMYKSMYVLHTLQQSFN